MDPFRAVDDGARERRYMLDMFSYPSGDLHMGHGEVFALADVIARYWFQQGYDVLHPVGWDSFGLPAENAAIKRNADPRDLDLREHRDPGGLVPPLRDLVRLVATRLHTSRPGVLPLDAVAVPEAVRGRAGLPQGVPVNWCPKDQTVLANEQVVGGHCERCGSRSPSGT